MRRFCSLLFILAIIVVGLGFYRGWFTVSGDRENQSNKVDVNLTVDPDKVKADAVAVKDKAAELTGQAKEKTNKLGKSVNDRQ